MSNRFLRQVMIVFAILALVAVSTVAMAHGHLGAKSATESHCPLCMAVHNAKHAVAAPVATPCFAIVQTAMVVPSKSTAIRFVQTLLTQDRAPPQL